MYIFSHLDYTRYIFSSQGWLTQLALCVNTTPVKHIWHTGEHSCIELTCHEIVIVLNRNLVNSKFTHSCLDKYDEIIVNAILTLMLIFERERYQSLCSLEMLMSILTTGRDYKWSKPMWNSRHVKVKSARKRHFQCVANRRYCMSME